MKKRRQHHVWQKYLKAWSINGRLYCFMDGRIFGTSTTAVAVESYFYKIGKLTAADVALIRFLVIDVEGLHPLTKKNHEDFLRMVTVPALFEGHTSELDDFIDAFRTNALEDYHAKIEVSFQPMLECLLRRDISFYSDEQSCIALFHFLASQHMRTKGVKVRTIEILKEKNGLDASRVWGVMSHMFATNIAMSIFLERRRRKLVLVENSTATEFITGDQPLINLHGGEESPPRMLSWYYPISPQLALLLTEVDEEPPFSTANLTSAQIVDLNNRIVAASHSQIFARLPSSLEPYASK